MSNKYKNSSFFLVCLSKILANKKSNRVNEFLVFCFEKNDNSVIVKNKTMNIRVIIVRKYQH